MPAPAKLCDDLRVLHGRVADGPYGDLSDAMRELYDALQAADPDPQAVHRAVDDVEVQMMFSSPEPAVFFDINAHLDEVSAWASDLTQALGVRDVASDYAGYDL